MASSLLISVYFSVLLCHSTSRGVAIKIDEYVPTMIPSTSASTKYCMEAAPNRSNATNVNSVDTDVLIERASV